MSEGDALSEMEKVGGRFVHVQCRQSFHAWDNKAQRHLKDALPPKKSGREIAEEAREKQAAERQAEMEAIAAKAEKIRAGIAAAKAAKLQDAGSASEVERG